MRNRFHEIFHFYVHDHDLIITGTLELRKAISKWHFEMEDLLHKPDQIVVGTGSKELIFLAMNIFYGGKNIYVVKAKTEELNIKRSILYMYFFREMVFFWLYTWF